MLIFLCVLLTLVGLAILWFGHLEFKRDREERKAACLKREKLEQERQVAAEAAKKRHILRTAERNAVFCKAQSFASPKQDPSHPKLTKPASESPLAARRINELYRSEMDYRVPALDDTANQSLFSAILAEELSNRRVVQDDTPAFSSFSGGDSGGAGASDSWDSSSSSSPCDMSSSSDYTSCDTSSYSTD